MLLLVTLLCIVPGGYVTYEQRVAREQQRAVEALEELGGYVERDETLPSRSVIARAILGDESFGNVTSVQVIQFKLNGCAMNADDALAKIAKLRKTQLLLLFDHRITDAGLVHIARLKRLKSLSLIDAEITDSGLESIATLTELERLRLSGTRLTPAGINKLKTKLPKCTIVLYDM